MYKHREHKLVKSLPEKINLYEVHKSSSQYSAEVNFISSTLKKQVPTITSLLTMQCPMLANRRTNEIQGLPTARIPSKSGFVKGQSCQGFIWEQYFLCIGHKQSELLVLSQLFVLEQTYFLWLMKGEIPLSVHASVPFCPPVICLALEIKMTGAAKNMENCPEHPFLSSHPRFVMENLPCLAAKISSLLRCLVMKAASNSYRSFPFSKSWRVQLVVRRRQGLLHSCHLLIQPKKLSSHIQKPHLNQQ